MKGSKATLGGRMARVGIAGLLVACGGAQKDASTPAANAPQSMPEHADQANGATPAVTPNAPAAPPKSEPPAGSSAEPFPGEARMRAQNNRASSVDDAFRRIERAAGSDCAEACRALASMDHACGELCATASGGDERALCTRSTDRVRRARETVKRACRTCPGGTSVEASDPIPSSH